MRFVVIGGDAAGMSAASRAKRHRPELTVTVLEKTRDVSYSACGMPYNIADPSRPIEDLIVRPAHVFREKQNIDLKTGCLVETIDPKENTVSGVRSDGTAFTEPYDKLLIATGAHPVVPDLPGMDLPGVMVLKSLDHGRRIKDHLAATGASEVLILGMGYIALEMAESLRARGIAVSMAKPREQLLPWLHPDLSDMVRAELESNGVVLHFGERLTRVVQKDGRLSAVLTETEIPCDMLLTAIGIRPANETAETARIETGPEGAIAVDRRLQTSVPDIYAAGDCADAYHVVTGEKVWIPLALRANRAGWAVADNVCGTETTLQGVAGTAVFKVFELEVARTGLTPKEAAAAGFDPAEVVIKTRSRAHAHPGSKTIRVQLVGDRKSGRLLGAFMVGREGCAHRINAAAVALHAKMTTAEFGESDLAYAPPFGPTWDPLLTAANQLIKQL
jgi:NADPH-dependent 2,4-dienoyl-CoA reductase/sulfur reductase-like enzyme